MLEIDKLDAWYGDSHIVQSVSINVAAGEGVALLGRNGAGKTTLLKSIMNGGPRTAGTIRYAGHELAGMPMFRRARLGIGLVPEDRRIYPHLTVRENLEMARHAARPGVAPYPVDEVLGFFPILHDLEWRLGGELSGGQQQMLAVARTVLSRPGCLLLDEPTEGLAPVIVERMALEINAIRARDGMSLLLTEQSIWFARTCTTRLYVIDSGRLVFSGSWAEFDRQPAIQQRYLAV